MSPSSSLLLLLLPRSWKNPFSSPLFSDVAALWFFFFASWPLNHICLFVLFCSNRILIFLSRSSQRPMLQEPYPALTWHIRSEDRREFGACFRGRDISGKESPRSSEGRGEKRKGRDPGLHIWDEHFGVLLDAGCFFAER